MTLTDFLLARLADDEYLANLAAGVTDGIEDDWQDVVQPITVADTLNREDWAKKYGFAYQHIYSMSPARVLAECEAKRRIVEELVRPYVAERRRLMGDQPSWSDEHPDLLRLLAAVYADHPDYDEAWRA